LKLAASNLVLKIWVWGVAYQATTFRTKTGGAWAREHTKNFGPHLFFQPLKLAASILVFKKTWVSGVAYQATTFRAKIGGAELGEHTKKLEQPIYFCNP